MADEEQTDHWGIWQLIHHLKGLGWSPAVFLQHETQPCWAPRRCPAVRLWSVGGKPDSDSLHSPSCHQRLWTSHQGQFLATSWKDAGKWQDHPCSKDLTGSISLQGCSLWYKGESCTLLTTGTEHGWEGKPKKHLPLMVLTDCSPWLLQGCWREILFPHQSCPWERCLSVAGCIYSVGKKSVLLGGEWVVGPLLLPSCLVLSAHRHVCLRGGRGRRDKPTDAGFLSLSVYSKCLLGLGTNRPQNGQRVFPEEGTSLPQQAQEDLD